MSDLARVLTSSLGAVVFDLDFSVAIDTGTGPLLALLTRLLKEPADLARASS